MRKQSRFIKLVAALAGLALVLAACSSDDDNDADNGEESSGEFASLDLSAVNITIGSKDFTENQLVAEMFAQGIEAGGGNVTRRINLGGTNVNRDALLANEIQGYPEYNGTGWTNHLGHDDPSNDPDELYQVTADEDLEKNSIHWLGRSAFNNTYGFATGPDLTDENGGAFTLTQMAEYLENNPEAEACMEPEFPDRADGLVLFENFTGFSIPQNQRQIMDSGIIYNETAKGECAFGEIFTTDGRIPELNLTVVDDEGTFIVYNLSFTITEAVYDQAPEALTEMAEKILNNLEADTMAELNRQVDVEGKSLGEVVKAYLEGEGLI
ncbi:MAG: glycine betaine ABC transporter substrate-binding protein [Acidimicrobiia bacterium]